ncbi:hypothetical protein Tco_0025294 [Tanacetum coccineum]
MEESTTWMDEVAIVRWVKEFLNDCLGMLTGTLACFRLPGYPSLAAAVPSSVHLCFYAVYVPMQLPDLSAVSAMICSSVYSVMTLAESVFVVLFVYICSVHPLLLCVASELVLSNFIVAVKSDIVRYKKQRRYERLADDRTTLSCGNFSDTSSLNSEDLTGSLGHAFTVLFRTGNMISNELVPYSVPS